MTEEQYYLRYGVSHAKWLTYNKAKQKQYRRARGLKRSQAWIAAHQVKTSDILMAAGHCGHCGLLLSSDWHKAHPLQGCMRYL